LMARAAKNRIDIDRFRVPVGGKRFRLKDVDRCGAAAATGAGTSSGGPPIAPPRPVPALAAAPSASAPAPSCAVTTLAVARPARSRAVDPQDQERGVGDCPLRKPAENFPTPQAASDDHRPHGLSGQGTGDCWDKALAGVPGLTAAGTAPLSAILWKSGRKP